MTREEWRTCVDARIALLDEHFNNLDEDLEDDFYAISAWSVVRKIAEGYLELYDLASMSEVYKTSH